MQVGGFGGSTYLSDGADSFSAADAVDASLLGGTENDTFVFAGTVKDSSLVGGFSVDSLVLGDVAICPRFYYFRRITTNGGSALDGADYISVAGSLSSSAVYGNSGADSLLIGSNVTASFLAVQTMIW